YVNAANTKGPWDGDSWQTAFRKLERALAVAGPAAEIWVAAGTYRPITSADRTESFRLSMGVRLLGGFTGSETDTGQRNWDKNVTILSGDIGVAGDRDDNSYHVLVGANDAWVDGFTITGGNANGEERHAKGGGMINYRPGAQRGPRAPATGLSPTLSNTKFVANHAIEGGAVYNYDRGSPVFENVTFERNQAENGGAVVDRVGVMSKYSKCAFTGNRAVWRGGALYLDYGSRPEIDASSFTGNISGGHGGGVYLLSRASQLEHTAPVITGSTFSNNRAKARGGAISNYDNSLLEVRDSVFRDNQAGGGGNAVSTDYRAETTLSGCQLAGGKTSVASDASSTVHIR
ncbi:MAG: DUF1565 domain-containing protein, partial [bacterium]|nr:DUF1565 domain-containing protein [bacterium]